MENFDEVVKEIAAAASPEALEAIRVKVLGRRGSLTLAMRDLGRLNPERRRHTGAALNVAKDRIADALAEATARLGHAALEQQLAGERAAAADHDLLGIERVDRIGNAYADPLAPDVDDRAGVPIASECRFNDVRPEDWLAGCEHPPEH